MIPIYPNKLIWEMPALARALGVSLDRLTRVAAIADQLYRKAKPIKKADGSYRQPYDALPDLKDIQKRIKDKILARVEFPDYLHGSIKGREPRTNAELHVGAKILICEDIEKFFPSTSAALIINVWEEFFCFSPVVSDLLTRLTTRFGQLPEGACTSSYLANLVLWKDEPKLWRSLHEQGIVYSRYVDDLAISSKHFLDDAKKTEIVSAVYGMLLQYSYRPKREKHEIHTNKGPMFVTKKMMNRRVATSVPERSNVRAAVYQLEHRFRSGERGPEFTRELNRTTSRVGALGRSHKQEASLLKSRLREMRSLLALEPILVKKLNSGHEEKRESSLGLLPWE